MCSIGKLAGHVQTLVQDWAAEVDQRVHVVQRQRKFTASTLASTFLLGHLHHPHASDEQLAQMAATVGVSVTTQAVGQRYSWRLAEFLKGLFSRAIELQVASCQVLAPLLARFTDVQVQDSTIIALPEEVADDYPGSGGNASKAALKLQLRLSLKTGAFDALRLEAGRDCDVKTPLQQDLPPRGALRITDLGYFDTQVLERLHEHGVYWLSPLNVGTNVYDRHGKKLDLLRHLPKKGHILDEEILLGARSQVPCRLIAWRLPDVVVKRRRERLKKTARRKGRKVMPERWERCQWATLVTNVPLKQLSVNEARVLYRARWQIELLFKRWKSQGCVADMTASSTTRCLVQLWSRLLAALVQQWLLSGMWGRAEISLKKAWDIIRSFALPLAAVLHHRRQLCAMLTLLVNATASTIRQNKRRKPSTFELLNDPSKLPYSLT